MSTELKTIKGKKEVVNDANKRQISYKDSELHLTRFFGGLLRGQCLQLTLDDSHIQLERNEIIELMKQLAEAL